MIYLFFNLTIKEGHFLDFINSTWLFYFGVFPFHYFILEFYLDFLLQPYFLFLSRWILLYMYDWWDTNKIAFSVSGHWELEPISSYFEWKANTQDWSPSQSQGKRKRERTPFCAHFHTYAQHRCMFWECGEQAGLTRLKTWTSKLSGRRANYSSIHPSIRSFSATPSVGGLTNVHWLEIKPCHLVDPEAKPAAPISDFARQQHWTNCSR